MRYTYVYLLAVHSSRVVPLMSWLRPLMSNPNLWCGRKPHPNHIHPLYHNVYSSEKTSYTIVAYHVHIQCTCNVRVADVSLTSLITMARLHLTCHNWRISRCAPQLCTYVFKWMRRMCYTTRTLVSTLILTSLLISFQHKYHYTVICCHVPCG